MNAPIRSVRDRIITADARTVSGISFFDAITGSSPEKRAASDRLLNEQCIRAIERGDTYGFPPSLVESCKRIIAERVSILDHTAESVGDPFLKRRVG